jgi:hypothetical protein
MIVSNEGCKFFINGTQYGGTLAAQTVNEEIRFGEISGDFLNGQIDAVGIWNRALSDAEVAELYNNGTGLELDGVAQPTLVKMQAPVKFFGKIKFGV